MVSTVKAAGVLDYMPLMRVYAAKKASLCTTCWGKEAATRGLSLAAEAEAWPERAALKRSEKASTVSHSVISA